MKNLLKQKLDRGKNAIGTFVWSVSPYIMECLGYTGLDFAIIDAEHSSIGTETTVELVRAAKLRGLTPVVRAKDNSGSSILKMLDLGAEALVVPGIQTVEDAKEAVSHAKYMDLGRRGFGKCRLAGYGFEEYAKDLPEYFRISNEQTLLLPMCESMQAVEQVEEILAVPGIDGLFCGPYDLSLDMGIPGQFDDPNHRAAMQRVADACRKANKYALVFSNSVEAAKEHMRMGFQAPTIRIDTEVMITAYRSILAALEK